MTLSRLLLALASLVGFAGATSTSSSTTTTTPASTSTTTVTAGPSTSTTTVTAGPSTSTTTVTAGPTTTVTAGPATTTTTVTSGPVTTTTAGASVTTTTAAPTSVTTTVAGISGTTTTVAASDESTAKEKSVSAQMTLSINNSDLSCAAVAGVASLGPLAACAILQSTVTAQTSATQVDICATGTTVSSQTESICMTYDPNGDNTFAGVTVTGGTSVTADDTFGKCQYKCVRRRALEQKEQSARGRMLSTTSATIKTAHVVRSKTAISTTAIDAVGTNFAANAAASIATKVNSIRADIAAGTVPSGIPAKAGNTAYALSDFTTATGTTLAAFASNSVGSGAATGLTVATVAPVVAQSAATSATSSAATQSAMGALALMALGALVF